MSEPTSRSQPMCTCGHVRARHDVEPPYECHNPDDGGICECRGFTYPTKLGEPDKFAAIERCLQYINNENRLKFGQDSDMATHAYAEIADARGQQAIGPCGKHPKMFWVEPSTMGMWASPHCSLCREIEQAVEREVAWMREAISSSILRLNFGPADEWGIKERDIWNDILKTISDAVLKFPSSAATQSQALDHPGPEEGKK